MGMPKTKADCEREIAHLKGEIEGYKARIAIAKAQKYPGWQNVVASAQGKIAYCKQKIAGLQATKKELEIIVYLSIHLPQDSFVEWRMRTNEPLMDLFSESDWRLIFPDVEDNAQLEDFLQMDCGRCLVAYNSATSVPFGFIYVYMEDEKERKVSFHGGGWSSNNAFLNYRAYMLMIEALLQQGYKVRTACEPDNMKAIRFNRSVGFVNHYTSKNYRYFWISEKRLYASAVYRWLMKREQRG